jgi:hypothetical protein
MGFLEISLAVALGVFVGKSAYALFDGLLSGLFRK